MLNPQMDLLPANLHPVLQQNWDQLSEILPGLSDTPERFEADLSRVVTGSNFVTDQLSRRPEMLPDLLDSGDLYRNYDADSYQQALKQRLDEAETEEQLHQSLRRFRQREQVRLIWRDLTRMSDMRTTTQELSWLADACVEQTMNWLYNELTERWGTPIGRHSKQPLRMVVLGMGKLGANELNLSSDIDLIYVYPENGETNGEKKCLENQEFFIRLGKKLIQALDNTTIDGFVFRVDMRLRPFGSAGPLAISFDAMEGYYQEHGREWERYAMIKARVMAGDKAAGDELMSILRPFVYRKYIDFSAFDSLREMKDMISREVRRKGLNNNVKLGSGGIREVEFIAQVFQLLRGGRDSRLQQRELCKILPILPDAVGMPQQASEELMTAYEFLRNAEHAIQAVADKQTQELPVDEVEQTRLAFNMGFDNWDAFAAQLESYREDVRKHFADLIAPVEESEEEEQQDDEVWLSLWNDDLTTEQACTMLEEQGFDRTEEAWKLIEDLRNSRTVKMLQQIAQDRLLSVLPIMLREVAAKENATETLGRVLQLIQAVLRRSAYLVLLAENPTALQQLVKLCSASSWFSEKLTKQPILLDELIDPSTLYSPPDKAQLNSELRQQLLRIPEEDTEQLMDALRYFKNAHVLKVAASEITGALPLMKVSDYLTWTAEVILEAVVDIAWRLLTEKHGAPQKSAGVPCNPDFIVLGYGKMGGIELSYGSDLDLVFIHDSDPNLFTDGEKQIANSVFFTRLGQKIIHILNTFTTSGQLYEVDMRLRPSGNSGLLVSSLKSFKDYQDKEAWTWEHQALVRARVVAGDLELKQRFEAVRAEVLGQSREQATLLTEVCEMREKMRDHLGSKNSSNEENPVFHLKHDRGGIVDIEFLVQYLVLNHSIDYPQLYEFTDNIRILDAAQETNLLSEEDAELLREAYKTYRAVGHRQTMQERSNTISDSEMTEMRTAVAAVWDQVLGEG